MIKRNVSAFINNSTECCCACCAYSVISGILKLFNFHITWHSPALVYVLFECVHKHCLFECVEPLTSFLALIFMGLLSIDCAALHEREIASHSWSVTLSLSLRLPFSSGPLFSPSYTPHHYFSIAYGDGHSWPDIQAGLCLREPQLGDSEVQ